MFVGFACYNLRINTFFISKVVIVSQPKSKKAKKKKPYRYCIFCQEHYAYLRRHIKLKHKDVPEVVEALEMAKEEQTLAFQKFRRLGIFEVNKLEAEKENPKFERERRGRIHKETIYCSHCLMFTSRRFFFKHQRSCQKNSCQTVSPIPTNLLKLPENIVIQEDYKKHILSKFRGDKIGGICTSDECLIKIGGIFHQGEKTKVEKAFEKRKAIRNDLRRLANLYVIFKEQKGVTMENNNVSDMFDRSNFPQLANSVFEYTSDGDKIKPGLKANLFYLIKKAASTLKVIYITERKDGLADEVDKFLNVFKMMENNVFGDAVYALNKNKNVKLRKPSVLPLEEDVKKFRNHVLKRMKDLCKDPFHMFDSSSYVELRDCACARLTLINARRGILIYLQLGLCMD